MSDLNLGQLIQSQETVGRDATHVAVAPVIAAEGFRPGQHVGLLKDGRAVAGGDKIGIVDPFLKYPVKPGEKFWLFLYPKTITNLRHEWSHPAFDDNVVEVVKKEKFCPSKAYLEFFASNIGVSYDNLMEHCQDYLENGHDWRGGEGFEGVYVDDEFWDHYRVVTGKSGSGNFFRCAC